MLQNHMKDVLALWNKQLLSLAIDKDGFIRTKNQRKDLEVNWTHDAQIRRVDYKDCAQVITIPLVEENEVDLSRSSQRSNTARSKYMARLCTLYMILCLAVCLSVCRCILSIQLYNLKYYARTKFSMAMTLVLNNIIWGSSLLNKLLNKVWI